MTEAGSLRKGDQKGDEVELYQFYGKVVVLDLFAEWCATCQYQAASGKGNYFST